MLHSMENATTFGMQAEVYWSAPPTYPRELFDWIAEQAPMRLLAWDVAPDRGKLPYSSLNDFRMYKQQT